MPLPSDIRAQIDDAVRSYDARRTEYANLAARVIDHLTSNHELMQLIHSTKSRPKDPEHLRDKLERQATESLAKKRPFTTTAKNVFTRIEDLAGVRLLHLRSKEICDIHPKLQEIFRTFKYTIVGEPEASSWDIETSKLFGDLGFKIVPRPTLYTSVHYIVQPHYGKEKCEVQVRTLAEELWGEVSHAMNYPHTSECRACTEQLLALARLTSGCTRLVDSIFVTRDEFDDLRDQTHLRRSGKKKRKTKQATKKKSVNRKGRSRT